MNLFFQSQNFLKMASQLSFNFEDRLNKSVEELRQDLEQALMRGPQENHHRIKFNEKLSPKQQEILLKHLQKLLNHLDQTSK